RAAVARVRSAFGGRDESAAVRVGPGGGRRHVDADGARSARGNIGGGRLPKGEARRTSGRGPRRRAGAGGAGSGRAGDLHSSGQGVREFRTGELDAVGIGQRTGERGRAVDGDRIWRTSLGEGR